MTLLGEPSLSGADGVEQPLASKQLGLVARLYGSNLQPVSRLELSRLLWPRAGAANARHSLSQALYILNRRTQGLLESDPERIRAGDASCDAVAFREAVSASQWATASQLYTGPFLRGFAIADAPTFSHWRDEVRADFTGLAEQVVEGLFEALRWPELLQLTEVLIGQGNVRENVIRAHLAAMTQERGPAEAQSFLEHNPDVAALNIEPLASGVGVNHPVGKRPHPFVGRSQLMERLGRLFEQSVHGQPAVALLRGEPGIGKTALADRFCRYLALKGARVLSAVGQVAEQNVPHGIVEQWLDDVSLEDLRHLNDQPWMSVIRHVFSGFSGDVNGLTPDIGAIGDRRLLESLRRLFAYLARRKPLILSVDDLHLADPASLGLLRYLFRPNVEGPTLCVATIRSEALMDLPQIHGWETPKHFEIGGLTLQEMEEWIDRAGVQTESSAQLAVSLYRQTGGNPLLISALLEEGDVANTSATPPPSVIEFYRPRIKGCSKEARRLLASISVVGEPRAWEDIAEIAGLSPSACAEASTELEGLNWITSDGDNLGLRHSLLGQAAISLISTLERRALHGRAGRVLAAAGESTNKMAAVSHDLAGNREAAFAAAIQAADACETLHAPSEREFFLKIALGNAPTRGQDAEVRIQLAELYLNQRRLPSAVEVLGLEMLQELEGMTKQRASMVRLQALAQMATDAEVLRTLWGQVQEATPDLPALVIAKSYTRIAAVAYELGLDTMAAEVVGLIIKRLSQYPPSVEHAQELFKPIVLSGLIGGFEEALRRFEALPEPSEEDPSYLAKYNSSKASLLVPMAQVTQAERLFGVSLGITERFALYDDLHALHNNLGVCLLERGKFDDAQRSFLSALDYAAATSPTERSTIRDNLLVLAYERGSFEEAWQTASSLLAAEKVHGWRAILDFWAIIGLSALEMGDLGQAREAEREINTLAPRSGKLGNDMSYVYIFLARMMEFRSQVDEAVASLETGIEHYRPRNRLAAVRMELEKYRLQVKAGVDCADRIDALLADLQGSGAVPLIEKAESLKTRAALKRR
ncbi:MAG: AAA family ATPase [Longimicrobiales bacterium]